MIDTIFRKEYGDPLQDKGTLKINHFAPYYERTLKLSQVKSLVYQHPPKFFMPFKEWTSNKTGNYAEMSWWSDYNQIKHNRIEKYSLATLGTTVTILRALQ